MWHIKLLYCIITAVALAMTTKKVTSKDLAGEKNDYNRIEDGNP